MDKIEVIFKKKREYNGVMREIGEVLKMYKADIPGYIEFGVVDYNVKSKPFDLENLNYKQLQNLCKKYKLNAVGKREDLIKRLKEKINKPKTLN